MDSRFARQLKAVRKTRGMTAQAGAEATDGVLTRAIIANVESGRRAGVTVDELVALAEALHVEPWELESRVAPDVAEMVSAAAEAAENVLTALGRHRG